MGVVILIVYDRSLAASKLVKEMLRKFFRCILKAMAYQQYSCAVLLTRNVKNGLSNDR